MIANAAELKLSRHPAQRGGDEKLVWSRLEGRLLGVDVKSTPPHPIASPRRG